MLFFVVEHFALNAYFRIQLRIKCLNDVMVSAKYNAVTTKT